MNYITLFPRAALYAATLSLLFLVGCDGLDSGTTSTETLAEPTEARAAQGDARAAVGVVYTLTNDATSNAVVAINRAANGQLTNVRFEKTGGVGSGDGLNGTSDPLVLTADRRYLIAVNGGSDDVSVLERRGRNLRLRHVVASGGERPISVTVHDDLVYVLNAGGEGNIAGFRLGDDGYLTALGTQPLNEGAANPSQIGFSPNGNVLVVTDKPTNTITTYVVDAEGMAGPPNPHPSAGQTPFGFTMIRDRASAVGFDQAETVLIVSEAFGGAEDGSATSSYRLGSDGSLEVISASVPTTESAACWAEATADGRYVYTTNTGSGTLSGYAIGTDGGLSLLDADGETGRTGAESAPLDVAAVGSAYLYVHDGAADRIVGFAIDADTGALKELTSSIGGLPESTVGVAAF